MNRRQSNATGVPELQELVSLNGFACTRGQAIQFFTDRGSEFLAAERLAFMLRKVTAPQAAAMPTLEQLRKWNPKWYRGRGR